MVPGRLFSSRPVRSMPCAAPDGILYGVHTLYVVRTGGRLGMSLSVVVVQLGSCNKSYVCVQSIYVIVMSVGAGIAKSGHR